MPLEAVMLKVVVPGEGSGSESQCGAIALLACRLHCYRPGRCVAGT